MKNKILILQLLIVISFYNEVESVKNITTQDYHEEASNVTGAKNHEELTENATVIDTHEGEIDQKKVGKQEGKIKPITKEVDDDKNEYPLNLKTTAPKPSAKEIPKTILNKAGKQVLSQTDLHIKKSIVNSKILPVKDLDNNAANRIGKSDIEKHELESVHISDCKVDDENLHKLHDDHDHMIRLKNYVHHHSDYHEEEEKEVQIINELELEKKNTIKYKKTGTLNFYEEADQKNNNREHILPILNVYVKKDKSINIKRPVAEVKRKEGTTPATKVPKEESISDITISHKSETLDVSKHSFGKDCSPDYNNGIPEDTEIKTFTDTKSVEVKDVNLLFDNNPSSDITATHKSSSLPDSMGSVLDAEIGDIIIKNEDIQEVIQKREDTNGKDSELYTVVDYSPQSNQNSPAQFDYDQTSKNMNYGQYNPYNTNLSNNLQEQQKLQYVLPQASYPQGYYTNQVNEYSTPSYSKTTNLRNRDIEDSTRYSKINNYILDTKPNLDSMNPAKYSKINDFILHKPNFPRSPSPPRYPFNSQSFWNYQSQKYDNGFPQDLTNNGANIAKNIPKPAYRNQYAWNNQGKPKGYKSYTPNTQYAYEEVVQPENHIDKIWRTWRKSEIILKGLKNKRNSKQTRANSRVSRNPYRNENYKAPLSKFNQRNRVIRGNGC